MPLMKNIKWMQTSFLHPLFLFHHTLHKAVCCLASTLLRVILLNSELLLLDESKQIVHRLGRFLAKRTQLLCKL